jgi:type I restriction enzyme, S subunit
MKKGWQKKTLGEVCIVDKHQGVHKQLPYVGLEHIESHTGRFIGSNEPLAVKSSTFKFTPKHLLYGRLRPYLNKVFAPDFDGHCSTEIFPFKPNAELSREFLQYWFFQDAIIAEINATCTGARMPRANMTEVLRFEFSFPPISEQQRIVSILDKAFDGIATAKANAEKNLQNARALFESHLQSVFTQRGNGWEEKKLGEVYDVRDGTHDSPKYHSTGYPLITSKNLKRDGLSFDRVNLINEHDYIKINQRSAVHKGDVLFAMIGTIGNPTLVKIKPNFAIKNVALFKIPTGQSGAFLKHYLASGWVISKMMKESKGTTQKFVGLGYLRDFPINVPPLAQQLQVVDDLDELSHETQRLESIYQQKLFALEELKKSLLHQAFSGQL